MFKSIFNLISRKGVAKFHIRKTLNGEQYYFVFRAPNGETLFSSETYTQKHSVVEAIMAIKKYMPSSQIENEIK